MTTQARLEWGICSLLFITFAYFYQGAFDNLNTRLNLAISLVQQRTFVIDSLAFNTLDKAEFNDHYYAEKAPGISLLAVLPTWLFSKVTPLEEATKTERAASGLLYFVTLIVIGLPMALSSILFMRCLSILAPECDVKLAAVKTLLIYTSSLLLPYATVLFGHGLVAVLFVALAYLVLRLERDGPSRRTLFLISAVLPFIVLVEFPCAVPASFFAAYVLITYWDSVRENLFLYLLPTLAVALLLGTINTISFGGPFKLGYGALAATPFAGEMSKGFFGVSVPNLNAFLQLLFGTYRGLFVYSPILILTLFGLHQLRRPRFAWLMVSASTALVLVNSSYGYWQGGVCFGPRHLVPIVPLLALGIAGWSSKDLRNPVFAIIITLSVLINLLGTTVGLFVDERDLSPLTQSYWDLLKGNQVSINPRGFLTALVDVPERWRDILKYSEVSWNWGERFGLKGFSSLLPLLLIWIVGLWQILRTSASRNRV